MLPSLKVVAHERLGAIIAHARFGRGPTLLDQPLVDRWALGGVGPRTVEFLIDQIRRRRPRRILECGPGVSTVAMARAINALHIPARITSLEHDERWAQRMRRRLRDLGLRQRVDLLVSPLVQLPDPVTGDPLPFPWYGRAADAAALGPYDLVFIDGPPARDGASRRAPALPLLWDCLADGAVVILDDGKRPGERGAAREWKDRFAGRLRAHLLPVEKGLWVFEKRAPAREPRAATQARPAAPALAAAPRAAGA